MVVGALFPLIDDVTQLRCIGGSGHHARRGVGGERQPVVSERKRVETEEVAVSVGGPYVVRPALSDQPPFGIEQVVERMDAFGEFRLQVRRTIGRPGLESFDPKCHRNVSALGRAGVELLLDARCRQQQARKCERYAG